MTPEEFVKVKEELELLISTGKEDMCQPTKT